MFYIVKHHKKYKKILLAILLIIIMDMLNVYVNFNNLSFICLTYWSQFDAHVERWCHDPCRRESIGRRTAGFTARRDWPALWFEIASVCVGFESTDVDASELKTCVSVV